MDIINTDSDLMNRNISNESNNSEKEDTKMEDRKILKEEAEKLDTIKNQIADASNQLSKIKEEISTEEERLSNVKSDLKSEMEKLSFEKARLAEQEDIINCKNAEIAVKEKDIEYREREIHSMIEQNDKKIRFCENLESKISEREKSLSEKEINFSSKEAEINRLKSELEAKSSNVSKLEEEAKKRISNAIQKENALSSRESNLSSREASENEALEARKLEFEKELQEEKKKFLSALNEEISQKRKTNLDEIIRYNEAYVKSLNEREEILKKKEAEFENSKEMLDFEKEQIEAEKKNNIRNSTKITLLVEEGIKQKEKRMKNEKDSLERLCDELCNKINDYKSKNLKFSNIVKEFGDDPQVIYDALKSRDDKIKELNEKVMNFDESKVKEYDILVGRTEQLESERNEYKKKYQDLQDKVIKTDNLQFEYDCLELCKQNLENQNEDLKNEIKYCEARINRLSVSEDPADRDARIKEIEKGILPQLTEEAAKNAENNQPENEIEWLTHIENKCQEYEIKFPHRILYAFHTALKISDWSTITVLAGVSGTGKSELPRLYSKFGGISFINVPVQPNWDSKESMLGYYNSIDNRFEAQEVLRFLAQCTNPEDYGKYMSIVLLDEMNLAHVELYFAEFLSKLEERRGKNKYHVPEIEVKLGSGMQPYGIKMARNILWTGTMNQDETTNSLSDKVLDRGIVINFPRPTELISRKEMKNMDREDAEPLLLYNTWKKWLTRKIYFEGKQEEIINKYRKVVNKINTQLEKVGRALGHRVWQSIEYYIANYPTVFNEYNKIKENPEFEEGYVTPAFKSAVKIAFEDQIVQKIMPKLRGIETTGQGGEVLNEIKLILCSEGFTTLEDDFKQAMELGYGQFMWNSAKYIDKSEELLSDNELNSEIKSEVTTGSNSKSDDI